MSKAVKVTPEYLEEVRKEFEEMLASGKFPDGKISFSKTMNGGKDKATIYFTAEAWTKMVVLIQEFDKEVAWHGVATRSENEGLNEYIISDILVYPQEVTGSTVNTDQEKYQDWLMGYDDDVFNNIRMQAHSHVNMGTSPSGVDTTHQEAILSQLDDSMFYIFMIWNKSFKRTIKIYELSKNILFEDGDIDVKIVDAGIGLDEFIKKAKELVKDKVYSYPARGAVTNIAAATASPYNPTAEKPKTQIGAGWAGQGAAKTGQGSIYDRGYYNNIYDNSMYGFTR